MIIKFSINKPKIDGFHFMKFSIDGAVHLVSIETNPDGTRTMYPDDKKHEIPYKLDSISLREAFFSEDLVEIV